MKESVSEFIIEFKDTLNKNERALIEVDNHIKIIRNMLQKVREAISSINNDTEKIPKKLYSLLKLIRNLNMETEQYKNIINALRIKCNSEINKDV